MEMMLEVAMGVMDTEDDKVADMVLKIPDDDFTDVTSVTVAIGDTYGDDAGFQELELMMGVLDMDFNKVAQPGGQISN